MGSTLDPQARTLLEDMEDAGSLPAHARSIAGTRADFEATFAPGQDPPSVGAVRDETIPGPESAIPIRMYTPSVDPPHPVLVFAHGGGWVRGSIETHDEVCHLLTRESGCAVVSVDYRRPPEAPFPAPLQDLYAAVEWVAEFGPLLDLDADAIGVAGDSAGGNLAAATALLASEREGPDLSHQLLLYPVLEYEAETSSYHEFGDGYVPTRDALEWYWEQYLSTPIDGANPYASPLRAPSPTDVPAATIVTTGFDPLRDEGVAYVDHLRESGIDVTHRQYDGMIHGFLSFPDRIDRALEAYREIGSDLRDAFARS
jgi:acetyl esterase